MTRVRVCHCVDNLAACGAQQVVRHLLTNLDRDRFKPLVYTFKDGPLLEEIERAGVTVRVLARRLPKLDPGLVRRLRLALRRDAIDVLHMHLFGACLHGTLAALGLTTISKVVTLHADRADNWVQSLGWQGVLGAADAVVAVSRQSHQAMGRRYRSLSSKSTVILNGIDLVPFVSRRTKQQAREALRLPRDRPLIGTIGRLTAQKGHGVLLAAFAEVRKRVPDVQLLVIGEGELLEVLREAGKRLGLNGSVRYLGSRRDVPDLLAAMDVFALSSLWEGLPLVLLEAMAMGTPVVATAVGGVPEVVKDDEDGLLVQAGDAHQLAEAIYRVLIDPPVATRLRHRALAKVRDDYDVRRMVREHEALYERLVQRS